MTALQQEWLALQAQHERYEGWALAVKLAAAAAAFATGPLAVRPLTAAVVLAVLWLQEAVLKTFQARLGERLLTVESCLRDRKSVV